MFRPVQDWMWCTVACLAMTQKVHLGGSPLGRRRIHLNSVFCSHIGSLSIFHTILFLAEVGSGCTSRTYDSVQYKTLQLRIVVSFSLGTGCRSIINCRLSLIHGIFFACVKIDLPVFLRVCAFQAWAFMWLSGACTTRCMNFLVRCTLLCSTVVAPVSASNPAVPHDIGTENIHRRA